VIPDSLLREIQQRKASCEAIAAHARRCGLDVDWRRVNRSYALFVRWRQGRLATGYLIRQTGIKWISPTGKDDNGTTLDV